MGKGISYRDPVGYNLATVAVALSDNQQAKAALAGYGYTEVSDAALETIRRNKGPELEKIRIQAKEAEFARRAKIVQQFIREQVEQREEPEQDQR